MDESGESDKPKLKLESLIKQLGTKLKGVDNFEVWKKGIKDIGKYRRWPAFLTETYKADEIEKINTNEYLDAREEGYFVMKSTVSSEFHYLFDSIDYYCFEEMWRVVCVKFDKQTTYHQGMKIQKFWQLSMESTGLTVDKFIDRI